MIKKQILIILLIVLNSCGYSSIYSEKNYNFTITEINYSGDRDINNFLKSKLKRYTSGDEEKKFKFDIYTSYKKTPISKDTTGKITVYQMEVVIIIATISEDFDKKYNFRENFLIKNDNDKFEEKSYENSIKENLTNTIFDKFLLSLISR